MIIIVKINIIIFIIAGVSLLLYLFRGLIDLALRNKYYKDSIFDNVLWHMENINDGVLFFSNKILEVFISILGIEMIVAGVIYFIYIAANCIKAV